MNKKLDTSPYKGVRDFYPEDQFIQNHITDVWRNTVEAFGYEEYGASLLEPTEIYTEKSGDEIVNEQTFTFTDRGDRSVTLRPEMTPTVARMVAKRRRELGFPLRWYSIPNLFRYEAPQRGRLREHWQLNVDLFGIKTLHGDCEIITVADAVMKNFGATTDDYEIRINYAGKTPSELDTVIDILRSSGLENIKIDPSLARGQSYYTGVVFEFFDTNPVNPRSILGGGRYDNLTSLFGDDDLPIVGFGAGDVTIKDFLETRNLLPRYEPKTKLYIALTNLSLAEDASRLAAQLRVRGVNVALDYSTKKIGDQIKTADKNKIPYILVFGEDEAQSKTYKIKNLATGEETTALLEEIASCVK